MQKHDVVILLGGQVKKVDGNYIPAPHTEMRAHAGATLLLEGATNRLVIAGGKNWGIRYDETHVFLPPEKPDFSYEAYAMARHLGPSEAQVIAEFIDSHTERAFTANMLLEELSATTEENAAFVGVMLNRMPAFTGVKSVGILTQIYHMADGRASSTGQAPKPGALHIFRTIMQNTAPSGISVGPIFVENVLADHNPERWIPTICEYYSAPKGGKQYDVDRMRQLLTTGQSLAEMME